MINIPMISSTPLTKETLDSINKKRVNGAISSNNITNLNNLYKNSINNSSQNTTSFSSTSTATISQMNNNSNTTANTSAITEMKIPNLLHSVRKGQKVPLGMLPDINNIKICLGWNVKNPLCDVDVSAFMLNSSGKVIGDDWFVFYGQPESPDKSTIFYDDSNTDKEYITIDFSKLNSSISKIVFVLTINEAMENNLNFSMIKDAYIRIINASNNTEIVSFKMDEYYSNVISMMIGEVYIHNGNWKFNAVGNGVARDLTGLCELYGVQVM